MQRRGAELLKVSVHELAIQELKATDAQACHQ